MLLVGVESDSPAEAAGLMVGDIIVAIDGQPVHNHDELLARLSGDVIDKSTPVEVLRGGQPQKHQREHRSAKMNPLLLLNSALDELLARVRPVLAVVHNGRRGAGAGVLAGDGLVLTSHHVVARGRSFKVTLDDDASYEARVLSRDPGNGPGAVGDSCQRSRHRLFSPNKNHAPARWSLPSGIPGASAPC